MSTHTTNICIGLLLLTLHASVHAVSSVNPSGVNINHTGTSTVFLTFTGTSGQTSDQAFWCGEINVPANTVTNSNPCVSGTLFGRLPLRLDQASSGADTLTDIMTIPPSVARRAVQAARGGAVSSFFYVRRFVSNGIVQYIAVTCRLAGGGARVPLSLTEVRPYFSGEQGKVGVFLVAQGESLPEIGAAIAYNGSGRLKGRWEIVRPGDILPEPFDLRSAASLPLNQRALQKRYSVLDTFDLFLPPTGNIVVPGPPVDRLPVTTTGPYQVLFRVDATFDKEGNSETGSGLVASGGVAGFPMPTLRYYVGTEDQVSTARRDAGIEKKVRLLGVHKHATTGTVQFSWLDVAGADHYRLEVESDNSEPYAAILEAYTTQYRLPEWVSQQSLSEPRWRISAYNRNGRRMARSDWQHFELLGADAQ